MTATDVATEATTFRVGDIVERIPDEPSLEDKPLRGAVLWVRGQGGRRPFITRGIQLGEYLVAVYPGRFVTNATTDTWRRIPREDWTRVDRVRQALAVSAYAEPESLQDLEALHYEMLMALLGDMQPSRATMPKWPTKTIELFDVVAAYFDEREQALRRLATHLAGRVAAARQDSSAAPPGE